MKMSIVTIPREIQLLIFEQLKVIDLVRVSESCHRLKDVARDPSFWKKLTLTYERIKNKTEACRSHVSRCSSLREIVITGEEKGIRSDKIMTVLMKAKNTLTSISLSPSFAGLSNSSIEKIGKMTQLTHLAVGGDKIGLGGISALACLSELRTLKVHKIVCGNDTDIPMAVLVDLFSKLKNLEKVEIKMNGTSTAPSDEVVKSLLNNNPNLHHLDITPTGLVVYPDINELSSKSLLLIADKCPQLTHIGIGHLKSLSDISIIKLVTNCPKLKHANFENTNFNDTALALMSKNCPDLEYLNIDGDWNVTEEALEKFANPATTANLKQLCVRKFFFSRQFPERLRQKLPNVQINIEDHDYEDSSEEDSNDSIYGGDYLDDYVDYDGDYYGDYYGYYYGDYY